MQSIHQPNTNNASLNGRITSGAQVTLKLRQALSLGYFANWGKLCLSWLSLS